MKKLLMLVLLITPVVASAAEEVKEGRFQLIIHPNIATYMIDTQTGKLWDIAKFETQENKFQEVAIPVEVFKNSEDANAWYLKFKGRPKPEEDKK